MHEASTLVTDRLLIWIDRRRYLIGAIVIAIYAVAFNGQWRPGPDTAEHVSIAHQLIHGQGFIHPTGWQVHLNPGLAYLIAAVSQPFGQVSFAAALAVMLLISLATLGLVFVLLRMHFGRPTAVLVTGMLAMTETYGRFGYELLTDMPFCFGLMLFLLGWAQVHGEGQKTEDGDPGAATPQRELGGFGGGWGMLVVGVGVMTLFRSVVLTVLIGAAMVAIAQLVRGPGRGRALMVMAVCFSSWFVMQLVNGLIGAASPAAHDGSRALTLVFDNGSVTLGRMVTQNLPKLATESTAEALFAMDAGPVVGVGLTLVVLAIAVRLWQVHRLWAMMVLAFFVQWLLVLPGDRYFLPILLPLLVGWWMSAVWLERRWPGGVTRAIVVVMLVLWVGPNLVYIGKLVIEQRRQPFLEHYEKGKFVVLQAFGERIREHVAEDALVIGANGQVLTWYSDRRVMDPKRLRMIAGWNKQVIADHLGLYPKLYLIEPPDLGQRRIMKRLSAMLKLGEPIAVQERAKGREPWVLCPAKLRRKFRKPLDASVP